MRCSSAAAARRRALARWGSAGAPRAVTKAALSSPLRARNVEVRRDRHAEAHAIDRFWRADSSKRRSGLGLPIARTLAVASGGSLSLEDGATGGLAVRVTLPAAT